MTNRHERNHLLKKQINKRGDHLCYKKLYEFFKMMDFESEVCVLPNTSLHIIPVKKGFDQYTVQICE